LPMLAHADAAASQPPNLENAATPCRTANNARRRRQQRRDPPRSFVRAPLQCRAPMLRSSFLIPRPWSLLAIGQPRLGSNNRHLPPATAKARRTLPIGLCVCVKGAHCVPATGQRLLIPSTNWPIRPEYHLFQVGTGRRIWPPTAHRPPASGQQRARLA